MYALMLMEILEEGNVFIPFKYYCNKFTMVDL